MQYHLVLTERCNKQCTYCGGTRHIEGIPLEHQYCIEDLDNFLGQDPDPVIGICGGRCLFSNQTKFWGEEWFNRICDTTKHMINELEKYVPLAKELIESGVLDETAFDYPEINNSCEIIP